MLDDMQDLYEAEYDYEDDFEFDDGDDFELDGFEADFEFDDEFDFEGDFDRPISESEEMELAAELLTVSSDEELEYFLGKLARRIGRGAKKFARSKAGKALGGVLKKVAKKALPMAGAALGNLVVPGAGGIVGGKLASMAGRAFGLELEGLSPEDQEFEVARRFVRLSAAATKNAQQLQKRRAAPPAAIAKAATVKAAKEHAPGLVRSLKRMPTASIRPTSGGRSVRGRGRSRSGRWVRREGRLIVLGA